MVDLDERLVHAGVIHSHDNMQRYKISLAVSCLGLVGSTRCKQWRIETELLYWYKRVKTGRVTVLNIRKLYLYFFYFELYVYFAWSPTVPLKHCARTTPGNSPI